MTYVIAEPCIDITDKSCIDECPVDCIYEGSRKLYINPVECIDCGACEPVCPVEAITKDHAVDDEDYPFVADNERFFDIVLPGRAEPIGVPGGARVLGPVGVDTPLVASFEVDR